MEGTLEELRRISNCPEGATFSQLGLRKSVDRSLRTPVGKTLLGRYRKQLLYPLAEDFVISGERKHDGAVRQAQSQRPRMSQPPSLSDCSAALDQCLIRIAETEEDYPQERLRVYMGGVAGVIDERARGDRIVKRKYLFQMRPRRSKSAGQHLVSTRGQVTDNKSA